MMRCAACQCGQLSAECDGEAVRVSICHCLACQKRSGAPFAMQARFAPSQVRIAGESREWVRIADSGEPVEQHFCPNCGSTVWYHSRPHRELFAIPVGAFADPDFPAPRYSVYESRKHQWVDVPGDAVEHYD